MLRPLVRALLMAGSAFALVVFVLLSVRVLGIAHPLDPVEGAVLARTAEFAGGGPCYREPAELDDPPVMPGLPLAAAPLAQTFGPEAWQPRAVVLIAMLLVALLVLFVARLETASWTLAASSVGFMALGLNLLAAPPGLAHPEPLMTLLVLAGFLALRLSSGRTGAMLSAVALSAAFFTDPQAAWFAAAAIFALRLEDRRRLLAFALVLAVLVGGLHVLLSRTLGPWFNWGAWGDPVRALRWNSAAPLQLVGGDLLGRLGVLTFATVLSFALPTAPWRGKGGLWVCMGVAAAAAALAATQTNGFGGSSLVPSLVVLAFVGPLSMQRVTGHLSSWPGSSRMGGQGVVLTALVLQFVMFFASAQAGLPGL